MGKQPHVIKKQNRDKKLICGAKTKKGSLCQSYAMTNGRCRLHGGKSTGPPKENKNAIKTHEYETIWEDCLDDTEKELFKQINLDKLKQVENEIKLTDLRIRRMLLRINDLKQKEFITTSMSENDFGVFSNQENTIIQIQKIEEALTRVQLNKIRLIDTKHKLELDTGANEDDGSTFDSIMNALKGSSKDLWDDVQEGVISHEKEEKKD